MGAILSLSNPDSGEVPPLGKPINANELKATSSNTAPTAQTNVALFPYANTSLKSTADPTSTTTAPSKKVEAPKQVIQINMNKNFYANQLIWLDPNPSQQEMQQLQKFFIVKKLNTVQQCLKHIRQRFMITEIPLVCAGSLFSSLEKEFETHREAAAKIQYIYIFCMDLEKYEPLKTHKKVVCVENNPQKLIQKIRQNLVALQLPNFRNFADNEDKTKQIKYSYFLTFLTNPIEESQRKHLTKECIDTLNITQEQKLLPQYYPKYNDHRSMLKLYSKQLIFGFLNKILKTNTLEGIGKAHIFIHDLNLAIKKLSSFEFRSKIPSVLFRGTQLSETEINKLKTNIDSTIELLGFLSTSKNEEVAKNLMFMKNALIKIYIPSFFRQLRQKNMKIRDGYIQMIQPQFQDEEEVLFNIKSLFSVLRVLSKVEEGKKMFTVEMLYGTVQLLLYLSENKKQFSFQVHNNLARYYRSKCKNCNSTVHLIGTSSKNRFCLKDFPPSALNKESFILENANKTVTGMPLEYDELTLKHFGNPEGESESLLCKKCQSKVRCSGCFQKFCLCAVESHDKEHLDKCYIMVEGELPRFMMLELNERELNLFENHYQLQSQITCRADAFLLMKEENTYQYAWSLYSERIGKSDFPFLEYQTQYDYYYNRAQSYRLRKYVNRSKLTIQGYQLCLKDYIKCFELVKDKQDQALRQSKAMMGMGIIQDDIAQVLQANEIKDNLPLSGSRKIFKDASRSYEQASQILTLVKKIRPLTNKEALQDISIKNCAAFVYWHIKQYVTAILIYEEAISLIEKIEKPMKSDLAKYLNNLTCCINSYVESLNWSDLNLIKKHLDKAVVYGKRSYQLRLCLFGAGYPLTKNSKYTFGRAQEHLKECNQRLNREN